MYWEEEKRRKKGVRSKEELDWYWGRLSSLQYGGIRCLSREGVFPYKICYLPEEEVFSVAREEACLLDLFDLEGKYPCSKSYTMNLVWLGSLCFHFRYYGRSAFVPIFPVLIDLLIRGFRASWNGFFVFIDFLLGPEMRPWLLKKNDVRDPSLKSIITV